MDAGGRFVQVGDHVGGWHRGRWIRATVIAIHLVQVGGGKADVSIDCIQDDPSKTQFTLPLRQLRTLRCLNRPPWVNPT